MKFQIAIEETLTRYVEVDASTINEAFSAVHKAYDNGDIIVQPTDCISVETYQANKDVICKEHINSIGEIMEA